MDAGLSSSWARGCADRPLSSLLPDRAALPSGHLCKGTDGARGQVPGVRADAGAPGCVWGPGSVLGAWVKAHDPGRRSQRRQLTAGPRNTRLVYRGDTEAGSGNVASPCCSLARPRLRSPRTPRGPLRAGPTPGHPGPPPAAGRGHQCGGPALIVSMGDDFQGEISSSLESLSFKATHQMSSWPVPRATRCSPVAFKFSPLPSLTPV